MLMHIPKQGASTELLLYIFVLRGRL